MEQELITQIWPQIILPIARLTLFITLGLFIANFIESLNWTHKLAGLVRPLLKAGRLSSVTGASFTVAFISGVSSNTMLAEAFDKGQLSRTELYLANLFNALPRFFLHLPTVFFLTAPMIKFGAFFYVGLTFAAALLQTLLVVGIGRLFLPAGAESTFIAVPGKAKTTWRNAFTKSIKRLKKRIGKILLFMIPVYILFFLFNKYGLFTRLEEYLATKAWFLSWLNPQSLGIVILHVTAEFSAGLAAASVLLAENSLTTKEVVLALLVGNILSTPIRAIRHQLPYYTGIYSPRLALQLIGVSQTARALCIILVAVFYYYLA
ncbi:MAG: membrane protein [Desulfobulbaceae bacterium BRH_c16a]|nr:MAG: membrane protein [Desulfobulbaceae bacterium BRH_c16a]